MVGPARVHAAGESSTLAVMFCYPLYYNVSMSLKALHESPRS